VATTFQGGAGKDILTGDGMDQFWITSNACLKRLIQLLTSKSELMQLGSGLHGVTGIDNLSITQSGADTLLNALDKDLAILTGIQANTLSLAALP